MALLSRNFLSDYFFMYTLLWQQLSQPQKQTSAEADNRETLQQNSWLRINCDWHVSDVTSSNVDIWIQTAGIVCQCGCSVF